MKVFQKNEKREKKSKAEKSKMNKMQRTADILDQVANYFYMALMFLAAIGVLGAAWGVYNFITGAGSSNASLVSELDFEFITLILADGYGPTGETVNLIGIFAMLTWIIIAVVAMKATQAVRNILQPVIDGQPFAEAVFENLKKLAIYTFVIGIVINIIDIAERLLLTNMYDLKELFLSDKITDIRFVYTIDISFVIYGAFLLLLAYIFRYGAELQQQVDETL